MRSRFFPLGHSGLILGLPLSVFFRRSSANHLRNLRIARESDQCATREPVGLALVQISAPRQRAQFTGADNTFVFTDLPPGNYWPVARKPGFLMTRNLRDRRRRPSFRLGDTNQSSCRNSLRGKRKY